MADISARVSPARRDSLARSLRTHLSASVALNPGGLPLFPVEAVPAAPAHDAENYEKRRDREKDKEARVFLEKRTDLFARRRLPFLLRSLLAFAVIVELPPGIVAGSPG